MSDKMKALIDVVLDEYLAGILTAWERDQAILFLIDRAKEGKEVLHV